MFRNTHKQINHNLILRLEERVKELNKADVTRPWTLNRIYILALVLECLLRISNHTKWMWPIVRTRVILRYLHEILDRDEEYARYRPRK